jgi:hypothetical protein
MKCFKKKGGGGREGGGAILKKMEKKLTKIPLCSNPAALNNVDDLRFQCNRTTTRYLNALKDHLTIHK